MMTMRPAFARAFVVLCLAAFAATASAQSSPWPIEFPPRPLASRSVNFPPYDVETLANGLRVVVVLHHEQPAVSMRLLVRAGSAADPAGKAGLAHLTASLLDQGTTSQSAAQLNDAIDFIGAATGNGAGSDLTYLNMVVMKDSFEQGLAMLSDMARHPAFARPEIDRQRQQLLSSLRVSLDDPDFIANAVFGRLVFGRHPYAMPETGTPETIAAITRDDIVAFHDAYFAPNNAILAIVGDVMADEALSAARRVFGDWQRHEVPVEALAEPPAPARRLVIVNKPDSVQTEIRVGQIGIPRNDPDYMAVNLAIRILGGEGSNRLHQVLRTQRGLTYGAEADFDTMKDSGDFMATTNTRSAATAEVLRLIVDEFWRLQRERVSERELADAKAYLSGSFPLTIETPDAIALQVLNVVFYGLPVQELQTFRDRVNAVTADDIQRVARRYLKPDRLSVVLVGNAAAFASELKGAGFDSFEMVDLDNLDLAAADLTRRVTGISAPDSPAGGGRIDRSTAARYRPAGQQAAAAPSDAARMLLDRVVAAKGGLDALQRVRTIVASQVVTNPTPNGPVDIATTTYIAYPDRFRIELKLPTGTIIEAMDGSRAWIQDPQGVHDPPAQVATEMKESFDRDVDALLVGAATGKLTVRQLDDATDSAGRMQHALEISGTGVKPIVLYIDPDTMLVSREAYAAQPGQPNPEDVFSAYQAVNGLEIPFSVERHVGQVTVKRRITDIRINTTLDPALFTRPGS